jgi:hypothetical protein
MRLCKLWKLSAIDKCARVFVPPLAIGKWTNGGILWAPLRNLQMCRAFIAALTSEKRLIAIKKRLFRNWQLITNFFIAHLPIFVPCKNKGAGKCLIANYCLRWRCNFKGSQRMGDGRTDVFLMTSFWMSLVSAGSISLDSTFKCNFRINTTWTYHSTLEVRWEAESVEQEPLRAWHPGHTAPGQPSKSGFGNKANRSQHLGLVGLKGIDHGSPTGNRSYRK